MLGLPREVDVFGASVGDIMESVRSNFDFGVGRHLSEILDSLKRIDWKALSTISLFLRHWSR